MAWEPQREEEVEMEQPVEQSFTGPVNTIKKI